MSNTYFISYDLNAKGQDYEALFAAIKSLGGWAKVQKSFWYLKSAYNLEQVFQKIAASMDRNDSLMVVDVGNKNAKWVNIDPEVAKYICDTWHK
jgi:hypothetical protein